MDASRREVLRHLAQRIEEIEASCHPCQGADVPVGIPPLERLLPRGRLPAGSLVELVAGATGTAVWTLALLMARAACSRAAGSVSVGPLPACAALDAVFSRALVIADVDESFYPPAAVRLGIDLSRLIVIRTRQRRDAYAALEQALRCPGVGAAIGWFDASFAKGSRGGMSALDGRRLQLAAEEGGGIGFLLRPEGTRGAPSFAALRLLVSPVASAPHVRGLRVEVLRCQGGKAGQTVFLEIDDETVPVGVPAGLALAATGA